MIVRLFVLGLALGVVTDLLVNKMFFSMERGKDEYYFYMMVPRKKYIGFLLNIIYGIVLCSFVACTYQIINILAIKAYHLPETTVVLGGEPVLFGIFCMGYDMLFLHRRRSTMSA